MNIILKQTYSFNLKKIYIQSINSLRFGSSDVVINDRKSLNNYKKFYIHGYPITKKKKSILSKKVLEISSTISNELHQSVKKDYLKRKCALGMYFIHTVYIVSHSIYIMLHKVIAYVGSNYYGLQIDETSPLNFVESELKSGKYTILYIYIYILIYIDIYTYLYIIYILFIY